MSDELDDLKTLMDAATPAPDEKRRAVNLELARKTLLISKDPDPVRVPMSSEACWPA